MSEEIEDLYRRYGPAYRWLVTATGMCAAFTMVLMGTVANVAVPNVMGAFGVGQDMAQFLATAFIATMTASQLLSTWFVAVFGSRLAFTLVLILFAIGGLVAAGSPSLEFIIAGRVIQGFAAGIVQPLVMATILRVYPHHRRGTAMGIYSVGLVLALGLGPVVGGITIDALGWRYIFYVPLVLVLVSLIMGAFFMPVEKRRGPRPEFDLLGYSLLCISLFSLMWGIANGQRYGWGSSQILMYLGIGLGSGAGFVFSQIRPGASLLDLSLLRNFPFAAAAVVAMVYGVGNFSTTYLIPVFGQLIQGYSPTRAGLLLLPAAVAVIVLLPISGALADRLRPEIFIYSGFGMFAVGIYMLADSDINTTFWYIAGFALVGRLGMALIMPGLLKCALGVVAEHQLNAATGTINFFRQIGGAFGINTLVALLERRSEWHGDLLAATQNANNSTTLEYIRKAGDALDVTGFSPQLNDLLATRHLSLAIQAQADTLAFQDGFLMIVVVFLFALLPAWVLSRARRPAPV